MFFLNRGKHMHILFKWCILRQCAMLHFTHYLHDIPWIPSHLYSYFQSIFSHLGIRQRRVRDHIPEFRYSFRFFFPKKASYCLRNFSTEEEAKYSLSRFYLKWVHSYFQMYNWFSQVKKKILQRIKKDNHAILAGFSQDCFPAKKAFLQILLC